MQLIDKTEVLDKIQKERNSFDSSLSPVQLAMYEGLLVAEDIVRTMPEASVKAGDSIPYDRLLVLARKMHRWINFHSFNEVREYQKIGLTDQENKLLGYDGGITISAIDGK